MDFNFIGSCFKNQLNRRLTLCDKEIFRGMEQKKVNVAESHQTQF